MRSLILIFIGFVSVTGAAQNFASLGNCAPSVSSGSEEASAKSLARTAKLSDQDVFARLIFSEALSSGYWRQRCQSPSSEALFVAIGWGIVNRVQKNKSSDAFFETVFAKNQFRTSFSGKKPNPFAVSFLCPSRAQAYLTSAGSKGANAKEIFVTANAVASEIFGTYKKSGIPARYKDITNFFYPYSEYFGEMRPPWAKNADPTKNKSYRNLLNAAKPCAEFYAL